MDKAKKQWKKPLQIRVCALVQTVKCRSKFGRSQIIELLKMKEKELCSHSHCVVVVRDFGTAAAV